MKIHGSINIFDKEYNKGDDVPWYYIYPALYLLIVFFGVGSIWLAYGEVLKSEEGLLFFRVLLLSIFAVSYYIIFGIDEFKWIFINIFLGTVGILGEYEVIGYFFGLDISEYSLSINIFPFLFYVLFIFLLRQTFIDIAGARENPKRKKYVEIGFILVFICVYVFYFTI